MMVIIPQRQASKVNQHRVWLVGGVTVAVMIVLFLVLYSPVRVALFGKAVVNGERCTVNSDCLSSFCWNNLCTDAPAGVKLPACASNGVYCGSNYQCVDPFTDGNNCGSCEVVCTVSQECAGGICRNLCGNGVLNAGEQCDDGNAISGDGCSASCTLEEICSDRIDNDGDGFIDCKDADCDLHSACQERTAALCYDSADNDNDALIDCADDSCDGVTVDSTRGFVCQFGKEVACTDAFDNDNDGYADCRDADCNSDPACSVEDTSKECSNGIDDDRDGLTDCADSSCNGVEVFPGKFCEYGRELTCADGFNNDGVKDGIDCKDPDCEGKPGSGGLCSAVEICTDGFDNNADGYLDCADSACTTSAACLCGNGLVDAGEGCDDGGMCTNLNNKCNNFNFNSVCAYGGTIGKCLPQSGDGCSASCLVESGYSCTIDSFSKMSVCTLIIDTDGDGVPDSSDVCPAKGTAGMIDSNGCWYGDGDTSGCLSLIEYNDLKINFKSGLISSLTLINYNDMKINFKSSVGGLAC